MIIRKLFKFENAHVVRNCSSERCKYSIHGHSYKVEVLLQSDGLDNGQMVYDFGLMKGTIKDLIDSFDHAVVFWDKDYPEYITAMKELSARWISLPVSPSAEQLARVFFVLIQRVLEKTCFMNLENNVRVHSVIVHETDTGYAQAFDDDVNGEFSEAVIDSIEFSADVQKEWAIEEMMDRLKNPGEFFWNPSAEQQIEGITTP